MFLDHFHRKYISCAFVNTPIHSETIITSYYRLSIHWHTHSNIYYTTRAQCNHTSVRLQTVYDLSLTQNTPRAVCTNSCRCYAGIESSLTALLYMSLRACAKYDIGFILPHRGVKLIFTSQRSSG